MVGSESMHPATSFGCTPCHGGRDRATSFWSAGHSPETDVEKAAWTKKYDWTFDRFNETPVLPLKYAEAGCYRCHASEANFPDAPTLDAGMRVVEGLGCWGCHRIEGLQKQKLPRPGPSLEKVAAKVPREWATRWVMDPAAFRANTKMPSFFYLENFVNVSGPKSPNAAQAKMNEAAGRERHDGPTRSWPTSTTGPGLRRCLRSPDSDAARGQKLLAERGCMGCHIADPAAPRDLTGSYRQFGPNLSASARRLRGLDLPLIGTRRSGAPKPRCRTSA
jgi:mono/diheme cytochrome c family protein